MTQKSQTDNPLPPLDVLVNPFAILLFVALKNARLLLRSLFAYFLFFFQFLTSLFLHSIEAVVKCS